MYTHCIHIHTYTHACIYLYILHIPTYIYIYTLTYVHTYTHTTLSSHNHLLHLITHYDIYNYIYIYIYIYIYLYLYIYIVHSYIHMHMYNYIYIYHLGIHTCIYTQCMHTYIYTAYMYIYIYICIFIHAHTAWGITTPHLQPPTNHQWSYTHCTTLHHAYTHMQSTYTHTQYYITFHMHSALNHITLPSFGINRASIKACIGPVLALYPCHSNLQAQAGRKQADRPCTASISLLSHYTWLKTVYNNCTDQNTSLPMPCKPTNVTCKQITTRTRRKQAVTVDITLYKHNSRLNLSLCIKP